MPLQKILSKNIHENAGKQFFMDSPVLPILSIYRTDINIYGLVFDLETTLYYIYRHVIGIGYPFVIFYAGITQGIYGQIQQILKHNCLLRIIIF